MSTDRAVDARAVIARAISQGEDVIGSLIGNVDAFLPDADAVLAALRAEGIVLCRLHEELSSAEQPEWEPVYVPVAVDDRYPQ